LAVVVEHFAGVTKALEGVLGFVTVFLGLSLNGVKDGACFVFKPSFEAGGGEG
jgi:hypothetical protein